MEASEIVKKVRKQKWNLLKGNGALAALVIGSAAMFAPTKTNAGETRVDYRSIMKAGEIITTPIEIYEGVTAGDRRDQKIEDSQMKAEEAKADAAAKTAAAEAKAEAKKEEIRATYAERREATENARQIATLQRQEDRALANADREAQRAARRAELDAKRAERKAAMEARRAERQAQQEQRRALRKTERTGNNLLRILVRGNNR